MKTVAYIGNFGPVWSTENEVRRSFEYLGWNVIPLQENQTSIAEVRQAALSSDLLLITSTWDDALDLNEMITTFYLCAKKGIPTATLHLDTFWPVSRGERKYWLNPMFHTANIFTADGDWPAEWRAFGKHHYWLPPGVRHDAVKLGTARPEYKADVAFVGSNGDGYHEREWGYRKELLAHLREMCSRSGWSFRNPGGDDPKVERGDELNDFYESVSVTVGDSLCVKHEDARYFSDRAVEAPARGSFLVMPRINSLVEIYGDSMATYEWGDWTDLETMIRYYLEHSDERNAMRLKAQGIVRDGQTFVHRVEEMLAVIARDNPEIKH